MSYQLNLPLEELARDRGKLNTLRNMIAVVSAGIEKNAEIAASTIEFTVNEFADILRENTPFDILSADSQNSKQISPYPFQIFDLVQSEQRPKVFSTVKELANRLDLNAIKESFVNTELIGIDESQVDIPLPQSNLSFLKSVAFRTYEMPNGSQDEQIGPVVSDMRIQLEDNDSFENANKLLGYIRNNFIAYISALTALPYGRKPFVILHGPLIRAIGGFTHIIFDYKDAHRLLNINLEDAGEFQQPPRNKQSVVKGDSFTKHNLSLVPEKALDGQKNILEFNKFCINICDRKCGRYNKEEGIFPKNARPKKSWTKDEIQRREYPGFCLYFWVLRSLFDLARLSEITIASVVEDVSAATEMTRLVLPSLLAKSNVREQVRNSALNTALKAIKLTLPKQQSRSDVYNKTKDIVKTLRLSDSKPIIIARITKLQKENPLLSRDQASVSASIGDIGYQMSRRFTYSWAECTVIGTLTVSGFLDMNRCSVTPNAEVHSISETSQRQLFFSEKPSHLPLGTIESFGEGDTSQVPVTLNADELVTKHFCIFGMTGSGKTNTSAKLLEELMARGHRMIIFDSHDDYINIENFSNLFCDRDSNGNKKDLKCRVNDRNCDAVKLATKQLNPPKASDNKPLNEYVCERLIRTASVIYHNKPPRQIVAEGCKKITPELVNALSNVSPWKTLIQNRQVCSKSSFPELKYYGDDFQDFSINLLEAFQDEAFSDAQLRWLRGNINQQGVGIQYLNNLQNALNRANINDKTKDALRAKIRGLINIYNDARRTDVQSIDLELFFNRVADRENAKPQTVYRLSLTDLSNNLRKALVYGVVTYFFRSFKYGKYRATSKKGQPNAYPILFVLEEARSLIPKSSSDDIDISGKLARRAMREIGYEGRKFSLGFGLISQKPSTVDAEVVSQSNTLILHQLKSPDDQKYVRDVAESMSQEDLEMVKSLGTGRAIVTGVAIKSPVLLRVDFRYSQEGIEEPRPIENELRNTTEIRNQLGI